jgi:lambda repressor-like predicted transcriptional regulator
MRLTFKLLLDKQALMRELKKRGESITSLAKELGVTKQLLSGMLGILPYFVREVEQVLKRPPIE